MKRIGCLVRKNPASGVADVIDVAAVRGPTRTFKLSTVLHVKARKHAGRVVYEAADIGLRGSGKTESEAEGDFAQRFEAQWDAVSEKAGGRLPAKRMLGIVRSVEKQSGRETRPNKAEERSILYFISSEDGKRYDVRTTQRADGGFISVVVQRPAVKATGKTAMEASARAVELFEDEEDLRYAAKMKRELLEGPSISGEEWLRENGYSVDR